MSDDLRRELAPISARAWEAIDEEAKRTLRLTLAGRRIADFRGPLGWDHSAIGLGRVQPLPSAPHEGVIASLRQVRPLVELRAAFTLSRSELDAIPRGAADPELQPLKDAARAIAIAEDRALFHGLPEAHVHGIHQAAAESALVIPADYEAYPGLVANALAKLRGSGVEGPYAIVLGPRCFTGLTQTTTRSGYPVIEHVRRLLDGPVLWAPGIDGAAVLSLRGGDFELVVGRDLSIGYLDHSSTRVELYLEESFTFRVLTPEAAVPLVYESKARKR